MNPLEGIVRFSSGTLPGAVHRRPERGHVQVLMPLSSLAQPLKP